MDREQKFINPETCEPESIVVTPDIEIVLRDHWDFRCPHTAIENRRRIFKNNKVHLVPQCIACGKAFNPISGDSEAAEAFNEGLRDRATAEREKQLARRLLKFLRYQTDEKKKEKAEYQQYLRSPEWAEKRRMVMTRASDTCEGCGKSEATDVHHLTYANIKNEFLFELVALCRECHERLHLQQDERRRLGIFD